MTIRAYIPVHFFQFLRESTEQPGDGTTIVAWEDGDTPRFWWVFSCVDGVEWAPQPAHRLIDPLSIQPGQRSRDYLGVIHAHKRLRLTKPPVKLLAALAQQRPREIKQRWRPIIWVWIKRRVRWLSA